MRRKFHSRKRYGLIIAMNIHRTKIFTPRA